MDSMRCFSCRSPFLPTNRAGKFSPSKAAGVCSSLPLPAIRASGFRTSSSECQENHIRCIRSNSLSKENPGAELFFLVGCDAFFEMDTWYEFKEIFRLAGIVVLCRPECCENEVLQFVSKRVSELYRIVPGNREIRHPVLVRCTASEIPGWISRRPGSGSLPPKGDPCDIWFRTMYGVILGKMVYT